MDFVFGDGIFIPEYNVVFHISKRGYRKGIDIIISYFLLDFVFGT